MKVLGRDVFTGEAVELSIESGRITARQSASSERDMAWISPGWLDVQVNGWMGVDYNGDALDGPSLNQLCADLAHHGTTRHLATVITASPEAILRRLKAIQQLREDSEELSRRIPGYHVEGPFLSEKDGPRGAHNRQWIRNPSVSEFENWQDAAGGLVKIVTLAPERPGALDFIEALASRGIAVSLGHSDADSGRIREAVAAGAKLSTHLGNGISSLIDRHANPLWTQLTEDGLTSSLIADGHHLPDDFLKAAFRCKGSGSLILVSDVSPPGGMPPGRREWAGMAVEVGTDGRVGLAGTPYLAGAGHLLDRCVGTFSAASGCGIREAVRACTLTPAELIGMPESEFALDVGAPADLTLFRMASDGRNLEIEDVLTDGISRISE